MQGDKHPGFFILKKSHILRYKVPKNKGRMLSKKYEKIFGKS